MASTTTVAHLISERYIARHWSLCDPDVVDMEYGKLAGSLAAAYDLYMHADRGALHRQSSTLGWHSIDEPAKRPGAIVSLHCDPEVDLDDISREAVKIHDGGRRVRTAAVPFENLDLLAKHGGVERIISAHRLRPYMDIAREKVHLPDFQARTGLTGKGVLVGIVDTGIDSLSPAFTGRIERIWDQTNPGGTGVPEGDYGMELIHPQEQRLSVDSKGHGTHVASIVAGGDPTYRGVAPDARLVVVKSNFLDSSIIDGIQYIFRLAREADMPAVVNLSLGGHYDPHDGTDTLSVCIEEESGPGHVVCCAAGNEGDDDIHAFVELGAERVATIPCIPSTLGGSVGDFWLNGWYPGECQFEIAIASPSGHTTPYQGVRDPVVSPVGFYHLPDGEVEISTPARNPINGDHGFFISIEPRVDVSNRLFETWQLLVRGAAASPPGGAHVWILNQRGSARFNGPLAADSVKIGSPGAATSAITVGAYVTRTQWQDIDRDLRAAPWLQLHGLASFSSGGPRRDGAIKPDIAAPGAMIVGGLSRDSAPPRWMTVDSAHVAMQGTSMASPFVAGIVALLLEQDRNLEPIKIKKKLKGASVPPANDQGSFDANKWGCGLIDVSGLS
ncbi:S8 family serine peptidase [Streptomyces massasporeus]|uniref:S8 family serine peptidase n=1 Tax=Streptomyces massasporeus TaxID=67324 RepID=UPI0036EF14F3